MVVVDAKVLEETEGLGMRWPRATNPDASDDLQRPQQSGMRKSPRNQRDPHAGSLPLEEMDVFRESLFALVAQGDRNELLPTI
jgi:hypothetical protein